MIVLRGFLLTDVLFGCERNFAPQTYLRSRNYNFPPITLIRLLIDSNEIVGKAALFEYFASGAGMPGAFEMS